MAARGLQEDDVVCVHKKGKGYKYGFILENAESSSSSDEEDDDRLKKGFVRVAWYPSGKESVHYETQLKLLDRSLMGGEIVQRSGPDREGQSGIIIDLDVKCHLHIKRTNKYIYFVDANDLKPLQKFDTEQDVVLDDMFGRVVSVAVYLIILFPDGARCRVEEGCLSNFDIIYDKRERHGVFDTESYYEGQELRGPLIDFAVSECEWLNSTARFSAKTVKKKGNQNVSVKVEKVIIDHVNVQWIFKIFHKKVTALGVNLPETTIKGEDLDRMKVLEMFGTNDDIADMMLYKLKSNDYISSVEPGHIGDPTKLTAKDLGDPVSAIQNAAADNDIAVSSTAEEEIDAEFDGDAEEDEDEYEDESNDSATNDGDTRADTSSSGTGNKLIHKRKKSAFKRTAKHKMGKAAQQRVANQKKRSERKLEVGSLVEVEMVFRSSHAKVLWQDGSVSDSIPTIDLHLVEPDQYEFFPGDFVFPQAEMEIKPDYGAVLNCNHADRTCIVNWYEAFDPAKEKGPKLLESNAEVSVYDIKEHIVFNFHIGEVVGLITSIEPASTNGVGKFVGRVIRLHPPGQLTVKWCDETITECYPQEVFKVFEDDGDYDDSGDESSWEDGSESSFGAWETESEQEIIGEEDEDKDGRSSPRTIAKQKNELQSLLARAESALIRLKTLLNSFDVSITAPECFHDIIRIYRCCHDVDKILHASFFNDPELQNLIAQAKWEVKRDKTTKVSRQLSILLDIWGKKNADSNSESRVVRIGTSFSCDMLNLGMKIDNEPDSGFTEGDAEKEKKGEASGGIEGGEVVNGASNIVVSEMTSGTAADVVKGVGKVLRKEYSEPLISDRHKSQESQSDNPVVNLVGENCVEKSAKPEDTRTNFTRELCVKICENLQKQILKIHEEVKKRTNRIIYQEEEAVTNENGICEQGSIQDNSTIEENVEAEISEWGDSIQVQESHESDLSKGPVEDAIQDSNDEHESMEQSQEDSNGSSEDQLVTMKGFVMLEDATYNKFSRQPYQPLNQRSFTTAVRKELRLLQYSLSDGIFIKGFDNRLDLYSVMILGPTGTPYEDALFLFDFMLPKDYPKSPPLCHYHSFCTDRLNPNLYEDGKVCVSLLGTWTGKGSEMWTSKSNLLQVLLSIQGLILVSEPYYNEAGFERQRGSQTGQENSRMYNEMAVVKTIQSLTKMCQKLPNLFEEEIKSHLQIHGPRLLKRMRKWMAKKDEIGNLAMSLAAQSTVTSIDGAPKPAQDDVDNVEMDCDIPNDTHDLPQNGIQQEYDASVPSSAEVDNKKSKESANNLDVPEFSLFPISRGFCITLGKALDNFEKSLELLK